MLLKPSAAESDIDVHMTVSGANKCTMLPVDLVIPQKHPGLLGIAVEYASSTINSPAAAEESEWLDAHVIPTELPGLGVVSVRRPS